MQTKTSVLNSSLIRGGAKMGNAGFQGTPAMQVAESVYDKCRTLCLSLYPWSFALRRQRLALSAEAPQGPWPFAFALPSDSVRVVGAARPDPFTAQPGPAIRFEIVGDRLETDADGVLLTYVSGIVTTFPDLFADMLAWRVAFEITPYVSQGGASAKDYLQMFEQALDRAKVEDDAQEAPPAEAWPSVFLKDRRV